MDAIKLLLADHKAMKKLVKKVYETTEKAVETRKKLFKVILHEAKLHEKIEEKFLYPHLKEFTKSRPNAFEHHQEVLVMEFMLKKLSKTPYDKEEWTAQFRVLKELTDHHIEEEEDDKFVQARKFLSKDMLNEIGDKMFAYKEMHKK